MPYLSTKTTKNIITTCTTLLLILLLSTLLTACTINIGSSNSPNSSTSSYSNSTSASATTGPGAQSLQIYVEPDSGDGFLIDGINNAQKSVYLEMYLLTDKKIISALEDAAHRSLDVRVMLETHPYGAGSVSPTSTLDKLQAAGVKTEPTSPAFALTHEKGMIIDSSAAYIMTSNFTLAALGDSSSTKNREYDIIDKNTQDVQGVTDIFNADWNRTTAQYNAPNLVVSPDNSRTDFQSLINSAQKTLIIEAEEMQDPDIEQALISAAHRGVQIQVILPNGTSSDSGGSDSNSAGITTIKQGGIQVKEDSQLYMHAKIIVVDGQKAFVGSENISTASLDHNRELGLIISDTNVINTLQQTFQQDWTVSQSV
jgi:phosphatidylserine/phosphatidylglycerophosphate/cardiolipin synthase-like enzyme